jgi:hypothetical protein
MNCRVLILSPLLEGKIPIINAVFVPCKSSTGGSDSQCGHIANQNPSALTGTSPEKEGEAFWGVRL